jgi:hypothetical protein
MSLLWNTEAPRLGACGESKQLTLFRHVPSGEGGTSDGKNSARLGSQAISNPKAGDFFGCNSPGSATTFGR